MGAHGMGELHPHMTQSADSDDADFPAGSGQWRVGDHACAEQRGHRRQLIRGMADPQDELFVDGDALRIAAEHMARCVLRAPL